MRYISFAFVAEGSSDLHLKGLIENILIDLGADEVVGYEVSASQCEFIGGRRVEDKLEFLKKNYQHVDLYVVHRDADNSGYESRFEEIMNAADANQMAEKTVPIITKKMLEAWLLTDKEFIKIVAGNKSYNGGFNSINFSALEEIADPKIALENLLCEINGCEGVKLKKFRKTFPEMRMRLASGLSPNNQLLNRMDSYNRFKTILREKAGIF